MITIKNKYIVLFGILLAQITISGLYAWSIFSSALQSERGWTSDASFFPYALAQFIFAFTTMFSGRIIDKKGLRIALIIGGLFYGGGLILSSFATSPAILYLTYGLIAGLGVGFVYVCPLSTLIKWFPKNKGLITGLSVAVFGGGSIVFKSVISAFLDSGDVSYAFLKLGIMSMFLILIGSIFTNNPPTYKERSLEKGLKDYTTYQMIKTSKFKIIWLIYWLAVIPGILVLGAAKDIGIEVAGLEASVATGLITVLALSNAASRLVAGTLCDRLGTLKILRSVFFITIVSLLGLSFFTKNNLIFYLSIGGVAIGYGCFLTLFPIFTNQEFGSFRYASNYGVVYQAYGFSALTGILIKNIASTYVTTFIISAIAACLGLALTFLIKKEIK